MMENINNLSCQYENLQKSLLGQRTKRSMILAKGVPKSRINLMALTDKKMNKMENSLQIIPLQRDMIFSSMSKVYRKSK